VARDIPNEIVEVRSQYIKDNGRLTPPLILAHPPIDAQTPPLISFDSYYI